MHCQVEWTTAAQGMHIAMTIECKTSEEAWKYFKEQPNSHIPKYWSGNYAKAFMHG